jgi:hypothetical protein
MRGLHLSVLKESGPPRSLGLLITAEIRISMKNRDYHHKRAQKTGLQSEWSAYRSMRNKTTSFLRESKRNYYFKQINENKSDSGKLWKTLKSAYIIKQKGYKRRLY